MRDIYWLCSPFKSLFLSSVCLSLVLSGWIVSLAALKTNIAVGAIMMINAILFTAQTAMGVVMLKKVSTPVYVQGRFTGCDSK